MTDDRGRRRSVASILTEEFSGRDQEVVAVDASVAKGRAYLAVRCADGQVRPVYLWLDRIDPPEREEPVLMWKRFSIGESPRRWPAKVAGALTTWES